MTQRPSPSVMARVDQAHADASRFIDEMLTTGLTELQQGTVLHELFIIYGGGLARGQAELGLTTLHLHVLVSVAVARLAQMHHAVEQLADQMAEQASGLYLEEGSSRVEDCAAELRKLVDDHG